MNHHGDRTKLIRLQNRIRARKGLIGCGEDLSVALHQSGQLLYAGADRYGQEKARSWTDVMYLSCGREQIFALTADGNLLGAGRCRADDGFLRRQTCVRTVAVGEQNVAILLGSGRVLVSGDDRSGQCRTGSWPTVTDVVCGRNFTVGLTEEGTLAVAGGSRPFRYFLRSWQNVAGIFTDFAGRVVYAITEDGRLTSSAPLPRAAQKWQNLVFVAASSRWIWAVTATGQLLSTDPLVHRMSDLKSYISCAVSETHAVALTREGQVLAAGDNRFGACGTNRFSKMFESFEELSADRRSKLSMMSAAEHAYQIRLAEVERHGRLLLCGERVTACINADGRVLTSSGFAGSKPWTRVHELCCGNAHLVARHDHGRVSADGNDVDGCTAVSDWEQIKAVAAGKYHTLGLREDGTVLFCGRNDRGQGDVVAWAGVKKLYAADDYTVGVTHDGQLLLAGTPPFDPGFLGDAWMHPVDVVLTSTHMVCLYANGTVRDTTGLSDGGETMRTSEWQNVRAIAAWNGTTVGLCYGGRVLAVTDRGFDVEGTSEWKQIVQIGCGDGYIAGLRADGRVLIGGEEALGADPDCLHWRDVLTLKCGPRHLIGVNRSGQMLACGEDGDKQCTATLYFTLFRDIRQLYGYGQYSRQLEMEIFANRGTEPVAEEKARPVEPLTPEAAIGRFAVGMSHVLTLDSDDRVLAEGADDCGQCDLRTEDPAVRVAAGPYRSAAILADGSLLMTGRNSSGQSDSQSLNRELEALDKTRAYTWQRISCGYAHTAALRSDGRVYAVGSNPDGRCDTRQWRDVTDVSCGVRHTVACRTDGTCIATGDDKYGQCAVSAWRDVVAVAAGEFHSVALTKQGAVLAVGDDRKGQCDVAGLTGVVAVACLPEATLCVCQDGRVVIRGGSGELDSAVDALSDVVALDTCEYRIAAMTAQRELIVIPT